MSPGIYSETLRPRPSGRLVVLSTRFDQYGDQAQATLAVLVNRRRGAFTSTDRCHFPDDVGPWKNLYSSVPSLLLGPDVSRGRFFREHGWEDLSPRLLIQYSWLSPAKMASCYPPPTDATDCMGPHIARFNRKDGKTRAKSLRRAKHDLYQDLPGLREHGGNVMRMDSLFYWAMQLILLFVYKK